MSEVFVIGVDSSTSATKAVAFGPSGKVLGEGRSPIPLSRPRPLFFEQDPDDWWSSLVEALGGLAKHVELGEAAAIAVSNQRETVAFFDSEGKSLRPAIVWLDERCIDVVDKFASEVGKEDIQRITGKHHDITPVCYLLAWMREHDSAVLEKTAMFADVQASLVWRLTGKCSTSWASADPMGYFDMAKKCWAPQVLDPLGIDVAKLPELKRPCAMLGNVTDAAAKMTGLPRGLPVAAGGGDGQSAGMGVGVTGPGTAYLNLGTAVVGGSWHGSYLCDDAWRTLISMTGEGYIMESALRTGTFLVDWLVKDVFGMSGSDSDFDYLQEQAAKLPAGSDGLLLLPYWSGVLNPHWDSNARGAITGLSSRHGRAHLYRAVLEGIAMEEALCFAAIDDRTGVPVEQINLVGGGASSDLWAQIIADATGRICRRMETLEASALGAAMASAVVAKWYSEPAEAASAMSGGISAQFIPGENSVVYRSNMDRYVKMYSSSKSVADFDA